MNRSAKCLAVFGTGSDVGKSITVAALCRIFSNAGIRVAPYKAQNMSNNSFVTDGGGEMGRAQIVQAQAARVQPNVDMNPVLLKPSSDTGSQVVLLGKPLGNTEAAEYFHDTDYLFNQAKNSLNRLRSKYDLIVMEGAGSCAEVNLRKRDFVNLKTAHAANAPVILVADIDRGGVFAQIVGTLEVLSKEDRERIKGFIINRFRGDSALFEDGIEYLEKRTGLPVLGLIPYFYHIEIDSEDGLPLDVIVDPVEGPAPGKTSIAAVRLPHISNFTDFNAFDREPGIEFHYLSRPRRLKGYDLLILPGTKNVRFDLDWLRQIGWDSLIRNFAKDGGRIAGICGGYQMLGKIVRDPHGVEGQPGDTKGLGLLDVETELHSEKVLTRSAGTWVKDGHPVEGYEIHMGLTSGPGTGYPVIHLDRRNGKAVDENDGAQTEDGRIWGTYLHGIFDQPDFRKQFILSMQDNPLDGIKAATDERADDFRERQYELLAAHFQDHLNMDKLYETIEQKPADDKAD